MGFRVKRLVDQDSNIKPVGAWNLAIRGLIPVEGKSQLEYNKQHQGVVKRSEAASGAYAD
jgi:hypothetical protein